ncbi:MAG TPA: hypothetical protein QGF02_04820 [Candidatus Babeliales bacterium]|nr:hypothetical protein [Candidatus Babeliales bacterium]
MARKALDAPQRVLEFFSMLPERIVTLHGTDNVAEFLLYDICHHEDFGIQKAAFFIDSPEFNCMKGVAGINKENKFTGAHWESPEDFSDHMNGCDFNQQVRMHEAGSIHKSPYDPVKAKELSGNLDFKNPQYHSWSMKHGNRGFLIYEGDQKEPHEHMVNSLHLLSFCPVF